MPASARDGLLPQHELDAIDRFLVEAMPLPIASAWHRVLQHDDAPLAASPYAVEALTITLQLLLALLLAEAGDDSNSAAVRKHLHMLEKPRLGGYGHLVLELARAEGQPGSVSAALHGHFYQGRKQTQAAQALVALGTQRNDMIHEGTSKQLDAAVIARFVADLRRWLFALRWLAEWRLIYVDRVEVLRDGFAGQIVPLTGRDREPLPRRARWTAQLPTGSVALVDPSETRVLSLARLVRVTRRAGRVDVLLPGSYVGHALRLSEGSDATIHEDVRLDEAEIVALLRLGAAALANEPTLAETSLRALPQAWTVPEVSTPVPVQPSGGVKGLVVAGLLAIAAAGLLAFWLLVPAEGERSRIAPDLAFGRVEQDREVGLPAAPTPSDPLLTLGDAEAQAATDDVIDEVAPPGALAQLVAAQAGWDAATDSGCGALQPLADALATDQERLDADAAALDAALRWGKPCDRTLAEALAATLRAREGEGVDRMHVLRRALSLERRLLAAALGPSAVGADPGAAARERAGAAARALADVAAIVVWTDGDPRQRVDAAAAEESVRALRGLELSLLCALDDAADLRAATPAGGPRSGPAGAWFEVAKLDLGRLEALRKHLEAAARVAGGLAAPVAELRACLADAYDGLALRGDSKGRPVSAGRPSARRLKLHWQAAELRAADARCCGATAATANCGDPVVACAAEDALADAALAACRAEGIEPAEAVSACLAAVDAAGRQIAARVALGEHDPRCLPATFLPQPAAEALRVLRRDVPAPTAAATMPRRADATPRDAALGRWLLAIDGLGARAPRSEEAAREFAQFALFAARVLFVASYAPPPGGCTRGAGEGQDAPGAVRDDAPPPRWSVRAWLATLQASGDPALVSEAHALLCRALAAEADTAALQAQLDGGRCPR